MKKSATTRKERFRSNGHHGSDSHHDKERSANKYPFAVLGSKIQGKGVFATRRIRPNQRLIRYIGEIILSRDADERYDDEAMDRHHTFLFTLDEKYVIDATKSGNESRWINHSCDPNCEAVEEDDQIWVYAFKNIQPGTELTYDYGYKHEGELTRKDLKQYPCYCGSQKCRGTILKVKRKRKSKRRKAS